MNGRREVNVVIEFSDGRVAGIEVKASAAPGPDDARHLRWLRDSIGDRFLAGAVLHTGPRPFRLDESILALPVHSLWSEHPVSSIHRTGASPEAIHKTLRD
ncbi:MAG: hypothetical protein ACRDOK_21545 [Streptosporangiaceae bacterium]